MAKEDKDKNTTTPPDDENQQGVNGSGSGSGNEPGGAGGNENQQNPNAGRVPSPAAIKKAANAQGLEVVKKDVLEDLLAEVQSLRSKVEKQNDMITAVADKGRLAKYNERDRKPIERVVRVNTYEFEGVLRKVVGWAMITDQVFKNSNGVYVENQTVRIILDNDKKIDMPYIDFVKKTQHINATIKSRTTDEQTGALILTLVGPDGKEFVMDSTFVN